MVWDLQPEPWLFMETTMRRLNLVGAAILVCGVVLGFAGCDREDAEKAGDKVERAADKAGDAIERGLEKAGDATNRGIQKANEAAKDVVPAAKSATTRAVDALGRGAEKAGDMAERAGDRAQSKLSTAPANR
jgi:hypothetical protein